MRLRTLRWTAATSGWLIGTGALAALANGPELTGETHASVRPVVTTQVAGRVQPAAPENTSPELPPVTVEGEAQTPIADPINFNPGPAGNTGPAILTDNPFRAGAADGYRAGSSTTGSLIAIPDLEFPGTVNVVTSDTIRDQQILRMEDALRDVPGAVFGQAGANLTYPDSFFLRGFAVTAQNFRKNGFLDPVFTPRDFANVERVEILKGPASVLYGATQPAGAVNFITKKPLDQLMHAGAVTLGSWDLQRYTIDSTGPINESGSILYRLNAAYEDRNGFRDYDFNERVMVAPVISWIIDTDTVLTWEGEYQKDRRQYDYGAIAVNGSAKVLPIDRFYGSPDDFNQFHHFRTGLSLTRRINDDWAIYVGQQSVWYDQSANATSINTAPFVTGLDANGLYTGGFVNRTLQRTNPNKESNHAVIANLTGEFELLGVDHTAVIGTEMNWLITNEFVGGQSVPFPMIGSGYDLIDPSQAPPYPTSTAPILSEFVTDDFTQKRFGFYFQDLVNLTDDVQVLAGVRYDNFNQIFDRSITFGGFPALGPLRTEQTYNEWTPRVGVIWSPVEDVLSFYSTYSRSFNGSTALAGEIDPKPEFGNSFEGGSKLMLSENLQFNVAGFYIERENVTLLNESFLTTTQVGLQRSMGAELSLAGQITDQWSMIGTYAYTDTRQFDGTNPIFNDKRIRGVPLSSASLWSRYNLVQERDRTFGGALGLVYVGDRLGDFNSTFELPSYTRWDAGLFYQRGPVNFNLYVENLFDVFYTTNSINQYSVGIGNPANIRAQVAFVY